MRVKGFTLIELLVVVAIIAALFAILLPAFSNARAMGRQMVCANNLKQIGVAFSLYLSDYNDYFPPWGYGWEGEYTRHWHAVLISGGYVAGKIKVGSELRRFDDVDWKTFLCPEDPNAKYANDPSRFPGWDWRSISYGYNYYFIGSDIGLGGRWYDEASANMSQLANPSATILLTDSLWAIYIDNNEYYVEDKGYFLVVPAPLIHEKGVPYARHGAMSAPNSGNVNVLWCDGHVSSRRAPEKHEKGFHWATNAYSGSCLGDYWRTPEGNIWDRE